MIHDLDIVLSAINSEVAEVQANGVSVISKSPDIANARIVFKNRAVANLTASRISLKNMRKARFFQKDAYLSLDFHEKSLEEVLISDAKDKQEGLTLENFEGIKKNISINKPEIKENNAILSELESFAEAIQKNETPVVDLEDGYKALRLAQQIVEAISNQNQIKL